MWDRRAEVDRIHDGDTITVLLDQGFGDTKTLQLRLFGVYAPELKQPGGPETRDFLGTWLQSHSDGTDWPWVVTTARKPRADSEQTTLGRYVGTLTTPDGTENLNLALSAFIAEHGYSPGIGG